MTDPKDTRNKKNLKPDADSGVPAKESAVCGRPCVYMLLCRDGSLYTGWTNDFEKRLATHNRGKGAKYTRSRTPVTPVYLEYLPDKIAAARREAAIKKLRPEQKRRLIASARNQIDDFHSASKQQESGGEGVDASRKSTEHAE